MKNNRYNEKNKEGKVLRVVSINEEQAKRFNSQSKTTELIYELESESKDVKTIELFEKTFNHSLVVEAYNKLEGVEKVAKNIAKNKLVKAIEGLQEDLQVKLLEDLK